MTRPSRGISNIQEKAKGNIMKERDMDFDKGAKASKKDPRKTAPSNTKKRSSKLTVKGSPMDKGSVGPAMSSGVIPGFKKGGKIDGCAAKGKTKGKIV